MQPIYIGFSRDDGGTKFPLDKCFPIYNHYIMKLKTVIKFLAGPALLLSQASVVLAEPTSIDINPGTTASFELPALITAAVQAVIVIAGLLTFAFLVWGGIEWLTSGGDKEKYEAARGRITAAVIGLVIVVAAWAILQVITNFLGLTSWDLGRIGG